MSLLLLAILLPVSFPSNALEPLEVAQVSSSVRSLLGGGVEASVDLDVGVDVDVNVGSPGDDPGPRPAPAPGPGPRPDPTPSPAEEILKGGAAKVMAAISSLALEDQFRLGANCRIVLANKEAFDKALVELCKIVAIRLQ